MIHCCNGLNPFPFHLASETQFKGIFPHGECILPSIYNLAPEKNSMLIQGLDDTVKNSVIQTNTQYWVNSNKNSIPCLEFPCQMMNKKILYFQET